MKAEEMITHCGGSMDKLQRKTRGPSISKALVRLLKKTEFTNLKARARSSSSAATPPACERYSCWHERNAPRSHNQILALTHHHMWWQQPVLLAPGLVPLGEVALVMMMTPKESFSCRNPDQIGPSRTHHHHHHHRY